MNTFLNSNGCGATAPQPPWGTKVGAPIDAINYGDVLVWHVGSELDARYHFLPLELSITENLDGAPHAGMFDPGGMGFFFATIKWYLKPERLEMLRRELGGEDGGLLPHLSFAPVTISDATIVQTDVDGTQTTTEIRTPAPNYPHTTIVQFQASSEQRPAIQSALQGNAGRIQFCYNVERQVFTEQTFTLVGAFPEDTSPAALDAAIADGLLTLTPTPESDEQRKAVLAQSTFGQIIHSADVNSGQLEITLSTPSLYSFEVTLDLGRAMAAHLPINDPLPPD